MKCSVCKIGKIVPEQVRLELCAGCAKSIVFENLPVRVCQNCGEEFITHSTMVKIQEVADRSAVTDVRRMVRQVIRYHRKPTCTTRLCT